MGKGQTLPGISPVCAIVGGIAGQHVLRVVTKQDKPLDNLFLFDVEAGKNMGLVEKMVAVVERKGVESK